eukprot:scaffold27458_cov50-Phaeocystis_antarctica.AAC.3
MPSRLTLWECTAGPAPPWRSAARTRGACSTWPSPRRRSAAAEGTSVRHERGAAGGRGRGLPPGLTTRGGTS